jgi:hypothetical protein
MCKIRGRRFSPCLLLIISELFFLSLYSVVFSYQEAGGRPSPQIYHSMVYHAKVKRILLFGGQSKSGWVADLREIWAYDVMNGTWEKVGVYEACPVKGSAQAPAYDSESDRIIVLNTEGETWAYDYDERRWEKKNPMQTPKTRAGHRMAYDSESDRMILFGGFEAKNVNSPVYEETWAYDCNSDTWTLMAPEMSPPKRMYHAMAYDSKSDRVIVWGGRLLERLNDNAVWAYDFNSNTWTRHESPAAPQPELTYPGMICRSASNRMVIFGGAEIITPFDCEVTRQTWTYELNTNTWRRLAPEATPPSMGKHAMVYNPQVDKIVVFGGEVDRLYSDHIIGEIWIYDPKNNTWEKKE